MKVDAELLEGARHEDWRHRELYQRSVSAENLRKLRGVGAGRSRTLVELVRAARSIFAQRIQPPRMVSVDLLPPLPEPRFEECGADVVAEVSYCVS